MLKKVLRRFVDVFVLTYMVYIVVVVMIGVGAHFSPFMAVLMLFLVPVYTLWSWQVLCRWFGWGREKFPDRDYYQRIIDMDINTISVQQRAIDILKDTVRQNRKTIEILKKELENVTQDATQNATR